MLTPADVIAGASVTRHPGAYVLGIEDTRITFLSQQVRALELAHALHHGHLLKANARVAVIGGGAAGITLAAALALQGGVDVRLFEQESRLLPLQSAAQRRRIDPHIYEWPKPDAEHERALLPILDWQSGSAVEVGDAVLYEFEQLRAATHGQPSTFLRHTVTGVEPVGDRFLVHFKHDTPAATQQSATHEFDVVVLAIGFGIEPPSPIPNTQTASYWHDAGVPGASIDGNQEPTFFVSGNGDGGLIDLIASAEKNFRHSEIVLGIAHRTGVQALRDQLLAIDAEALAAEAAGNGFDFIEAYDAAIGAQVEQLGLVDDLQARLRPGVQLYFQTRQPELLSVRTARLNRFAVYLLRRACGRNIPQSFHHIVCDEVVSVPLLPADRPRAQRLDCNGTHVVADWVIARRGPDRNHIRQPFEAILAGYEAEHAAWIRRFPEDSIAPSLGDATRAHFTQLAKLAHLPPPRYRHAEIAAAIPRSGKLWMVDGQARWSGEIPLADVATLWSGTGSRVDLAVIDAPGALLPRLAQAVARLAIHSLNTILLVDVARWRPYLSELSVDSPNSSGLAAPSLGALQGNASILNPVEMPPDQLAMQIHQVLDQWLLDAVNGHLIRYIAQGEDPQKAVSFVAAACLRQQMRPIWESWVQQFRADPALLARFLGLATCARDDPDSAGEASTLAGRQLLLPLIKACAIALMVATVWQTTSPHAARPGNLARSGNGSQRTGHVCAAGFIGNEDMTMAALRHAWTTEFVVLPMLGIAPDLIAGANSSIGKSDTMLLGQSGGAEKIVLAVDPKFRVAAQTSAAALNQLLSNIEQEHFARLKAAIQTEVENNV